MAIKALAAKEVVAVSGGVLKVVTPLFVTPKKSTLAVLVAKNTVARTR